MHKAGQIQAEVTSLMLEIRSAAGKAQADNSAVELPFLLLWCKLNIKTAPAKSHPC